MPAQRQATEFAILTKHGLDELIEHVVSRLGDEFRVGVQRLVVLLVGDRTMCRTTRFLASAARITGISGLLRRATLPPFRRDAVAKALAL